MSILVPVARRAALAAAALGRQSEPVAIEARVRALVPTGVEIAGLAGFARVGDRVLLRTAGGHAVDAEIVAYREGRCVAAPFGHLAGHGPNTLAVVDPRTLGRPDEAGPSLSVSEEWLGRVVDPLGRPLDRLGPLPQGSARRQVRAAPPEAATRARLGAAIDLGVRAMNLFTTCREGQRLALFAGSGVGKSTLLAMLARNARCEVVVLALVGERGREVREFIEDDLGPEGLARSVVVVATSDSPALLRREAAFAAMAIAEHFRDQGRSVLLLMDSLTRFCLACREIGLTAGEMPALRGYPPSTFAELPRLLERAGPGPERDDRAGQITAFFTVLVEGDDHEEPVTDAVRGILDGHVVLSRAIAERGRFPAVDVLRSLSRTAPGCLTAEQAALSRRARVLLSTQAEMADMVRLGAYRAGSDPAVDEAVARFPALEALLAQDKTETAGLQHSFATLATALGMP